MDDDLYPEGPEPYEDDLEEFERNEVAKDISLGEGEPDADPEHAYEDDGESPVCARTVHDAIRRSTPADHVHLNEGSWSWYDDREDNIP